MKTVRKGYNIKILSLFIITILLCQSVALGIAERNSFYALRPFLITSKITKELNLLYGIAATNPWEHDPTGEWAYFTHTGICEAINYDKLLSLYNDPSKAKEELFCCFKSSHVFSYLWMPVGFILDISKDGEVLYAGRVRSATQGDAIEPLTLNKEDLSALKNRLRKEQIIDISPSEEVKEMDVTNANIRGICVDMGAINGYLSSRDYYKLRSFSLLIAMAIKYNLPIILVDSRRQNIEAYTRHCYKKFEQILEKHKELMEKIFKQINIEIADVDLLGIILQQVRPKLIVSNLSEMFPDRNIADTNL